MVIQFFHLILISIFVLNEIEQPRQRRKTIFYDEDDERPSTSRSRRSRQRGYYSS
jgi:hypothetical protein